MRRLIIEAVYPLHKLIMTCLMVTALPLVAVSSPLPNIGSSSGSTISNVQEQELGKEFMQMIRQAAPLLDDPVVVSYVQQLGHRLVSHSNKPKQAFYFFVVRDDSINAFAGPSGYVGVNTGLILAAQSEGELAAVLSHEISHVTQRHIARMIGQQKQLQLASLAAMLAGVALGMHNPQIGEGIASAATAGGIQGVLNFTRGYEREADEVGMETLAHSGYSPTYMPEFFQRLQDKTKGDDSDVPEFLLTHPLTAERLADAQNRAHYLMVSHPLPSNPTFYLVQSRIVVDLSGDPRRLAASLQTKIAKTQTSSMALRYAYMLALAKSDQFDKAQQVNNQLIAEYPNELLFKIAQANIFQAKDEGDQAIHTMQTLYQKDPSSYLVILAYANLLSANKQYDKAISLLQKNESRFKQDENYLYLLSMTQGKAKQLTQAYMTRANLFLLQDNPDSALIQLHQALQFTKDPYLRAQIQNRINRINSLDNKS